MINALKKSLPSLLHGFLKDPPPKIPSLIEPMHKIPPWPTTPQLHPKRWVQNYSRLPTQKGIFVDSPHLPFFTNHSTSNRYQCIKKYQTQICNHQQTPKWFFSLLPKEIQNLWNKPPPVVPRSNHLKYKDKTPAMPFTIATMHKICPAQYMCLRKNQLRTRMNGHQQDVKNNLKKNQ